MGYRGKLFFIWFALTTCSLVQRRSGIPSYNTFSDPTSTLKFNHLIIDERQGWVFIGAVNYLYQLSPNLTLIRNFSTVPMSNYKCGVSNCPPKVIDNYNKILVLNYEEDGFRLISCGSYSRNSCEIYRFNSDNSFRKSVSNQNVVSSSPKASTVAFVVDKRQAFYGGRSQFELFVGQTNYIKDSVIPAIAIRSLHQQFLLKVLTDEYSYIDGYIPQNEEIFFRETYREKYIVNYVYGFSSGLQQYFLTTQMNSTQLSPYISKLIRIGRKRCTARRGDNFYSEIPIKCTDIFGKEYNLVQAANVTAPDYEIVHSSYLTYRSDVLFGIFAQSKQSLGNDSNNPSHASALCWYTVRAIEDKFQENIEKCSTGNGYNDLKFISETETCTIENYTRRDYECSDNRTSVLTTPFGGNLPLQAIAVITFNILATAVIAVSKFHFMSVIIGTENGHLKHIALQNTNSAAEFNDVVIDEGYPINSDLRLNPQKDYLYAMTEHKLTKIDLRDLLQFPSILSFNPHKGPWDGGTDVSIRITNFDISSKNIHYDVKVAGIPCTLQKQKFNLSENITCITNTASNLTEVHGPVEVFFNGVQIVSEDKFTLVDPKISKLSSIFGSILGGTELIIQGVHLNAGKSITVFIGNISCPVSFHNSSIIKCTTLKSNTAMRGTINVKIDNITRSYNELFNYIDDSKQMSNQTGIPVINIVYIVFTVLVLLIIVSCFVVRKKISNSSQALMNMQQSMNNFCMETMALRQCIKQIVIEKNIELNEELSDVLKLPNITIVYTTIPITNTETLPGLDFLLPLDEQWEFPRSKLILGKHLGEGEFGKVLQGEALDIVNEGTTTTVAVKMLKDTHSDADMIALASEMEMMKLVGTHENILCLLGCCTQDGELLIITEFALHGNLRDFLRKYLSPENKNITQRNLTEMDLLMFAIQIANGMEYLASIKCIHRDLAARNVLVSEDYMMKIGDFGLARDIRQKDYYRKKTGGRLPVKWMAPEALQHSIYTSQSDVWSYGILLWEIITLGGTPYASISDLEKLYQILHSGYRMEIPPNCSQSIYNLMLKCWSFIPEHRPLFSVIVKDLKEIMPTSNNEIFKTCNLYS